MICTQIDHFLEEGKYFLARLDMEAGNREAAFDQFSKIAKNPNASFYQGQVNSNLLRNLHYSAILTDKPVITGFALDLHVLCL